jgi:hypothetical protein
LMVGRKLEDLPVAAKGVASDMLSFVIECYAVEQQRKVLPYAEKDTTCAHGPGRLCAEWLKQILTESRSARSLKLRWRRSEYQPSARARVCVCRDLTSSITIEPLSRDT